MKPTILVISCAHGSHHAPKKYLSLFNHNEHILQTPRAYDLGAQYLAQHLHKQLDCDLIEAKVTRLLIDCNHSLEHARCFSKYSNRLSNEKKGQLIDRYYQPYHNDLQNIIADHITNGYQVLHLSIFTFKPILNGLFLKTAISLLYDGRRHAEKEVTRILHGLLEKETPSYKIRHNFPFLGNHDYVSNTLRKKFAEQEYLGIKLGINQALLTHQHARGDVLKILLNSLHKLLDLL